MCGITGLIDLSGKEIDPRTLRSMTDEIRYRGPDDEGYVLINQEKRRYQQFVGQDSPVSLRDTLTEFQSSRISIPANIGLGHRRFSIVDLTAAGHQPFFDADFHCCLVFNGEIYNYIELKSELEIHGIEFRTKSDTEVLIEAYKFWDTECFEKLNGFWALALYDFRKKCLLLSRDRLGKKPLYWTKVDTRVYFASEIKSLLQVQEISKSRNINKDAIWRWCNAGMRDIDFETCFENIYSFPSASWTRVDKYYPNNVVQFWHVPKNRMQERDVSVPDAAARVRGILEDAVRIRLRADVPIACELSGGLDSSVIVALAAEIYPSKLMTYTVRFSDPRCNEEPFARSVARNYEIDYRVIDPAVDTFWQNILAFTYLQEEPYHSPSMHTSQGIWSQMREQGTKVCLTGAAGDEIFAGYPSYFFNAQRENLIKGDYLQFLNNALHWTERRHLLKPSLMNLLRAPIRPFWVLLRRVVPQVNLFRQRMRRKYLKNIGVPVSENASRILTGLLYQNVANTLIPYWLRSGDKALMGIPFEARCPFLDYRLVDFAMQLPMTYLIRQGWHKWILRKAMEKRLPNDVLWRKKKMGFPFPMERFYEESGDIIQMILSNADNPFVDGADKSLLQRNWRAISFILWYELFFNNNVALFRKIEDRINSISVTTTSKFQPEFWWSRQNLVAKDDQDLNWKGAILA